MHRWLAVALLLGTVPKNVPHLGTVPSVTCSLRGDAHHRVYTLDQAPATPAVWRLSMRDTESGERWISLSLRGAQPHIAENTASLAFKNANGGRMVTLDVTPEHASLDVFVDHGLEVNIEPDLDPAVDRMNTNGPLTALDCTVAPQ
jgi:hypothetical protein